MPLAIQPPTCDFQPQFNTVQQTYPRSSSIDIAPEFSPITPKSHPVLPAAAQQPIQAPHTIVDSTTRTSDQNGETEKAAIAPAQFVAAPPSQPFSSDESVDGLALKAAISSLQFQRQKAREDIRSLDAIKKRALADPERFTQDVVAGNVKEVRHDFGSAQEVLESRATSEKAQHDSSRHAANAMDLTADDGDTHEQHSDVQSTGALPGPQSVVRMPYINWDKYNIMGEPLEALHEQQRRHPGSEAFQQRKGRDFSVTAPYSPFEDVLEPQPGHARNTSDGSPKNSNTPTSMAGTPATIDHPYETRHSSKY